MDLISILEVGQWLIKQVKPRKVLLYVEDNSDDIRLLQDEMRGIKWQCEFATSAEEALGMMKKSRFNVALIDIGLPQMDGASLALKIRDLYPHTRIFFTTGSSFVNLEEGQIIQVIRKPITAKALREIAV